MKRIALIVLVIVSGLLNAQTGLSKKDSNFVRNAAQHTLFEVKVAELAQNKASSAEVKSLAANLYSYHSNVSAELKQLASKKNIALASGLDEKSQKYYDKLSKKEGMDFDKAYTQCVVHSHKMGACYLKKESKKGKDADIKAWAATNYPVLEQHKEKGKETCKTLKKK